MFKDAQVCRGIILGSYIDEHHSMKDFTFSARIPQWELPTIHLSVNDLMHPNAIQTLVWPS